MHDVSLPPTDEDPPVAITAIRAVVAVLLVAGTLPAIAWVTNLGTGSAREFMTYGGDVDTGHRLGLGFATALIALLAASGYLCMIRISASSHLVPGWGIAVAVVAALIYCSAGLWLIGIGGMGGPQDPQPAAQVFGQGLFDLYATATPLLFAVVVVVESILRHIKGPVARITRRVFPALIGAAAGGSVFALTFTASNLHA